MNNILSVKTLGICLALGVVALTSIFIFKVPAGSVLLFGVILLCPLMHLWMMKDGGHKH